SNRRGTSRRKLVFSTMRKSSKLLLAGATVWPFFYMVFFFAFVMLMMFLNTTGGEPPVWFFIIFPLHFLTILLIFALTVFYVVNVFRNDRVAKDMKVLWAVVLFMGGIIAMPIYWYLYIWRETPSAAAPYQLNPINSSFAQTAQESAYVPPSNPPDWR